MKNDYQFVFKLILYSAQFIYNWIKHREEHLWLHVKRVQVIMRHLHFSQTAGCSFNICVQLVSIFFLFITKGCYALVSKLFVYFAAPSLNHTIPMPSTLWGYIPWGSRKWEDFERKHRKRWNTLSSCYWGQRPLPHNPGLMAVVVCRKCGQGQNLVPYYYTIPPSPAEIWSPLSTTACSYPPWTCSPHYPDT